MFFKIMREGNFIELQFRKHSKKVGILVHLTAMSEVTTTYDINKQNI